MPDTLTQRNQAAIASPRRRHWLSLPVAQPVEGSLAQVLEKLPHFGRQPFAMSYVNGTEIAVNPYLDMVYRVPSRQSESPVPVGVVSNNYRLVDHHHVFRGMADVVADFGINLSDLRVCGNGRCMANGLGSR